MDREPAGKPLQFASRARHACVRCKRQKLKCDNHRPCYLCVRSGIECKDDDKRDGRKTRVRATRSAAEAATGSIKVCELDREAPTVATAPSSPAPSYPEGPRLFIERTSTLRVVQQKNKIVLLFPGSPPAVAECLLDTYSRLVSWYVTLFHDPTIKRRFQALQAAGRAGSEDFSFLMLVVVIMATSARWIAPWQKTRHSVEFDERAVEERLLAAAERQMLQVVEESSSVAVMFLDLLASHYLFSRKTRRAFVVRRAGFRPTRHHQDMDIHVNYADMDDDEWGERVPGPVTGWVDGPSKETFENGTRRPITTGSYHRYKARLYRIAAPITRLLEFERRLPRDLQLKTYESAGAGSDAASVDSVADYVEGTARAVLHAQALALRVSYDNMQMLLHRPLISWKGLENQSVDQRSGDGGHDANNNNNESTSGGPSTGKGSSRAAGSGGAASAVITNDLIATSRKQCWTSAIQLSNLLRHRATLEFVKHTPLGAHVGMHCFTAGVMLAVFALSKPCSAQAQEAKQALGRLIQIGNFAQASELNALTEPGTTRRVVVRRGVRVRVRGGGTRVRGRRLRVRGKGDHQLQHQHQRQQDEHYRQRQELQNHHQQQPNQDDNRNQQQQGRSPSSPFHAREDASGSAGTGATGSARSAATPSDVARMARSDHAGFDQAPGAAAHLHPYAASYHSDSTVGDFGLWYANDGFDEALSSLQSGNASTTSVLDLEYSDWSMMLDPSTPRVAGAVAGQVSHISGEYHDSFGNSTGTSHALPQPPPVPAFEIPEPAPDNAGPYHDPIAPFRGLLSGLRLTPGEGTFLQAMLRLPHNAEPRPKTTHNSLNILDDTWYLQERLENPSPNSYFSRIDRKWLQFRDGQTGDAAGSAAARSASFSSTSSYASSQPKTPTGSQGFDPIFRIPGYPDAKLDDKWLQYDDPWFVYDEDEDEVTTDQAPAKKRRVEFAPEPPKKAKVAPEPEELAPHPAVTDSELSPISPTSRN
ncbi:unnamed protein product [Parascedosporium putredinis]|uniref:Zn(2)-C6 fungal-type domain-containing protein n=1 Tax=Parascedosporium putredinis TaxID=1442378 RepID=A0A9P1H2X6_9PEZI|nr:unnamed protein product [Parascedosporium putredinis]CAI7994028.1 unnamed protein product [Parascedosporium putredinis]